MTQAPHNPAGTLYVQVMKYKSPDFTGSAHTSPLCGANNSSEWYITRQNARHIEDAFHQLVAEAFEGRGINLRLAFIFDDHAMSHAEFTARSRYVTGTDGRKPKGWGTYRPLDGLLIFGGPADFDALHAMKGPFQIDQTDPTRIVGEAVMRAFCGFINVKNAFSKHDDDYRSNPSYCGWNFYMARVLLHELGHQFNLFHFDNEAYDKSYSVRSDPDFLPVDVLLKHYGHNSDTVMTVNGGPFDDSCAAFDDFLARIFIAVFGMQNPRGVEGTALEHIPDVVDPDGRVHSATTNRAVIAAYAYTNPVMIYERTCTTNGTMDYDKMAQWYDTLPDWAKMLSAFAAAWRVLKMRDDIDLHIRDHVAVFRQWAGNGTVSWFYKGPKRAWAPLFGSKSSWGY